VADGFDLPRLRRSLPIAAEIGPATLSYLEPTDFRPAPGHAVALAPDSPEIALLLASVPAEDATESGLIEISSPAFGLYRGGTVEAAAGYKLWPNAAHLCVLVAPAYRGQGLGLCVASTAVHHALQRGLLVQWRARPAASRAIARRLGFHHLGDQLSLDVRPEA